MRDSRRRLCWHGIFLFLLGLVTGLVETHFTNPRMGLAAHLEGVLNGILLLAVGALWSELRLSARLERAAFACLVVGAYANWAVTTLAAVFGTGALTPVAAPGRSAAAWQETLVTAGFAGVGLAMLAAALLILWGLRKPASR